MATYNLREYTPEKLETGDIVNLPFRSDGGTNYDDYVGGTRQILLPKGEYMFECWGSQASSGGTGGYAKGVINLGQDTMAYLTAGGYGQNGGAFVGDFSESGYSDGSGGASDIRLVTNDALHKIIVAGGGGYKGSKNILVRDAINVPEAGIHVPAVYVTIPMPGGYGGGEVGGSSAYKDTYDETYAGKGGTQRRGGAGGLDTTSGWRIQESRFVSGGFYEVSSGSDRRKAAGGGGWYGGGAGGLVITEEIFPDDGQLHQTTYQYGGAGGSGYVFSAATVGNAPSGYAFGTSYYMTDTVNISGHDAGLPITNPDGTVTAGHFGTGHVRITVIRIFSGIYIGNSSGKAAAVKGIYIGNSSGKARKVIKGYIGDETGKARRFL